MFVFAGLPLRSFGCGEESTANVVEFCVGYFYLSRKIALRGKLQQNIGLVECELVAVEIFLTPNISGPKRIISLLHSTWRRNHSSLWRFLIRRLFTFIAKFFFLIRCHQFELIATNVFGKTIGCIPFSHNYFLTDNFISPLIAEKTGEVLRT